MRAGFQIIVSVLAIALVCLALGCSDGRDTYKKNVKAMDIIQVEELDEINSIHRLDIHLDEGDELYDRFERPFVSPPQEHPPTR